MPASSVERKTQRARLVPTPRPCARGVQWEEEHAPDPDSLGMVLVGPARAAGRGYGCGLGYGYEGGTVLPVLLVDYLLARVRPSWQQQITSSSMVMVVLAYTPSAPSPPRGTLSAEPAVVAATRVVGGAGCGDVGLVAREKRRG